MSKVEDEIDEFVDQISELNLKIQSIEEAPLGITIADMQQEDEPLIYVNDGFERLTGYSREDILGENCRFLQGPETAAEPVARMREAIENNETVRVELRNYRKDGEQFWTEVTLAPLYSKNGEITHYVGFQQEISKRKEYEERLETQRDDLKVLNEMVRHDIRNDLQVALASMELLQTANDVGESEQLTAAIESIQQAIGLTNMAKDVADVMLDTDAEYHPVELQPSIQEQLEKMRDSAPEANISTAGTIPAVRVQANELLDSVFRNLLTNAVRHNDAETPEILVTATVQDEEVVVTIADNGPGVPDTAREHLFEKGWTNGESGGTGIGLYIVSRLVENYGGTITLADSEESESTESETDLGGATFVVRLPVANENSGAYW